MQNKLFSKFSYQTHEYFNIAYSTQHTHKHSKVRVHNLSYKTIKWIHTSALCQMICAISKHFTVYLFIIALPFTTIRYGIWMSFGNDARCHDLLHGFHSLARSVCLLYSFICIITHQLPSLTQYIVCCTRFILLCKATNQSINQSCDNVSMEKKEKQWKNVVSTDLCSLVKTVFIIAMMKKEEENAIKM